MTVSRETPSALVARYDLPTDAEEQIDLLLGALAAERDPPTTVRQRDEALARHVADSLSGLEVGELRSALWLADVGAGAGFPGLVLALAIPGTQVELIESAGRKVAVIERLARAARIENARAVNARAEEWAASPRPIGGREGYDVVTARAVAPLAVLAEYASPLLRKDGVLVAWKGARNEHEEQAARAGTEALAMDPEGVLEVEPFEGAERRHLHIFRKRAETPQGLPRRPGTAAKRHRA